MNTYTVTFEGGQTCTVVDENSQSAYEAAAETHGLDVESVELVGPVMPSVGGLV